ncbi:phosphomannomutase/phosphoglucomutase [Brevibacterium sp. BRM-1]|uniref:phosphomannomutase/phosphoglucomutase n=1 Tax=Brevibacterium sp. BRM-1 TaxID=2999062 RepID=UPI0022806E45|nr:phosphomannomutase/phosphoglucomutase [Brevibacterium sp. BRM-1]WAL40330.1 phosphomannomutase/phosphoglucomutase [Brevibacterium sp. BRM-1]
MSSRGDRLDAALKAYDLRGRVGPELDDDLLYALGWATARAMATAHGVPGAVIACDMRPDSQRFAEWLARGVRDAGLEPTHLGLASTDQLYFASGHWGLPGLMVTASHNPAGWNGVKLCGPRAAGLSRAQGLGEIAELVLAAPELPAGEPGAGVDEAAAAELARAYSAALRELTGVGGGRRLRIVADCGNGMGGQLLPQVFGTVAGLPALDLDVEGLYTELDGTFPNHPANPLDPANLVDAQAAVVAADADVGLAFDGDADRCFFIDETGAAASASAVGALVAAREIERAHDAGEVRPVVLHNLLTSVAVPAAIRAAGGEPVRTPVGHSGIKQLMATRGAVFACEHSAHFYFRDFFGADSGMLAACHILAALERSDRTLSQLLAAYAPQAMSGEVNSEVRDPAEVLEDFAAAAAAGDFGPGEVDRLDGVTLSGADFWMNVRMSNTEPLVRLNVESPEPARTAQLRDAALRLIRRG